MNAKHVALLALLSLAGAGCAVYAQPPYAPPPDQYQPPPPDQYQPAPPPDPYQPPDSYAPQPPQPPDNYAALPADDAQPYDQYAPDQGGGVDISFFYDQLSPYGHWVESRAYGWVWLPYRIGVSWRPYAAGHWVMTDYGWTCVSDEPFGWATYHYGRWVFDPDYGWEWIPGYQWGPAWVAWRTGYGYIGWAPLPPEAPFPPRFRLHFGGLRLHRRRRPAPRRPPQRARAPRAARQRQHQQESQALQAQQAQERARLQQIPQRERQPQGRGTPPSQRRQPATQERQQQEQQQGRQQDQ